MKQNLWSALKSAFKRKRIVPVYIPCKDMSMQTFPAHEQVTSRYRYDHMFDSINYQCRGMNIELYDAFFKGRFRRKRKKLPRFKISRGRRMNRRVQRLFKKWRLQ